ncbi:hypothetical protein D3C84_962310 [compost metagenome]
MGSLAGLDAMLRGIGPENILINQPDFISVFLSNFTIPTPAPTDLKVYGEELVTKLALIDPMWYKYVRNGETIVDMKYLTAPSKDTVRVLELHDELGMAIQIAPGFEEVSVGDVIREQFPMMVSR